MPLPTLTWQQRFLGSVSTTNSPVGVITAIRDYLATSVSPSFHWSVTTDGVSNTESGGSVAAPFIKITSSANVGANPIKILIAGSDSASFPPTNAFYGGASGDGDYRPEGNRQNALVVGIAPDGGTLNGAHTQSNPYGAARWSGYVKLAEPLTSTGANNVWIVDSSEVFALFIEGTDGKLRGFIAGALIAPLTDSAGETIHSGVGRIYGIATINAGLGLRPYWRYNPSVANFLNANSGSSLNNDQKYGQGISLCWDPDGDALAHFAAWSRQPAQLNQSTTMYSGELLDDVGNYASVPIPIVNRSTTTYLQTRLIGVLRQIKYGTPSRDRAVFQDGSGNDVGFAVSGKQTQDANCFVLSNS